MAAPRGVAYTMSPYAAAARPQGRALVLVIPGSEGGAMVNNVSLQALDKRNCHRLTLQGELRLRSGDTATSYFDKYLFEGQPKILSRLASVMAYSCLPTLSCMPALSWVRFRWQQPFVAFGHSDRLGAETSKGLRNCQGCRGTIDPRQAHNYHRGCCHHWRCNRRWCKKAREGGANVKTAVCAIWRVRA